MSGSTTEELKSERASADKMNLDEKNSLDRTASPAAPAEGDEDTPVYPGGWKLTLIVSSLCLAVFLVALDQTIIAPALGAITAEYKSVKDIVSLPLRGE